MRTLLTVALAVAGLALAAPQAGAEASAEPRRLAAVFVDVEGALPRLAASAMRDEAVRSLRKAGVELDWRQARVDESFDGTRHKVVLLRRAPAALARRCTMGSVIAGPDAPRAAWIYLDSVLRALRLPAAVEQMGLASTRDLGVALGKVAAHELIHAMVPELPHAASGLMSANMGRSSLISATLPVDEATRAALRPVSPMAPAAATLAAPAAAY
ncbi:MAG: hypothetical protein KJ067_02575 [Vicinamibacteria bacterium]|jgi:hypothetical protein|nr:hypothetical protein [Vicinamibacteria bacterium]